jgi:beta-glucanase (GH16 family)
MSADTDAEQQARDPRPGGARRIRGWWIAVIAVLAVALLAGAYVLYGRTTDDGWETVWRTGFDGSEGDMPSSDEWIFDTGTSYPGGAPQWGTGEIQTYTEDPENVGLDGEGNLRITATRDGEVWRSARLETKRADFRAEEGQVLRVQARAKMPTGGPGYWAAFWMLGEPFRGNYVNWPSIGEIDVMEFKGGAASEIFGTFHCGVTPGGPCNENNGIGGKATADAPLPADFHTYGIEWDRSASTEEIRWYLDGENYHTVKATDVDAETWSNATDHGFFILVNLAMGGAFPGPPDETTKPGESLLVDEITVERR